MENNDSKNIDYDFKLKKKLSLAIYHDGEELTSQYIHSLLTRFAGSFTKILIVSEDEIEGFEEKYDNLSIVTSIKPVSYDNDWLLILEPHEFPSIQLMKNLDDLLDKISPEVKVLKLPIVLCDSETNDLIAVQKPVSRIFRQNLNSFNTKELQELDFKDYPLVKILIKNKEQ